MTRRNQNIRETNVQLKLRVQWTKWEWQAQSQRRGLTRGLKENDRRELIDAAAQWSSLSSTSLVNQYRVPISWKTEERILSYVLSINAFRLIAISYQYKITNILTLISLVNFTTQNSENCYQNLLFVKFLNKQEGNFLIRKNLILCSWIFKKCI